MSNRGEETGPMRRRMENAPDHRFQPEPPRRSSQADSGAQPDAKRGRLLTAGVAVAVLLGATALVLALISLNRGPEPAAASAESSPQQVPTADADRALCEAIAPLMKENDDRSNAFLASGEPGSPEQSAALPQFVTDTQDWARRTQEALDAHATPPRFAARTLQRYIDDMQLFVASVRPGAGTKYDEAAWTDSIVAYGGPLATCQALGIEW